MGRRGDPLPVGRPDALAALKQIRLELGLDARKGVLVLVLHLEADLELLVGRVGAVREEAVFRRHGLLGHVPRARRHRHRDAAQEHAAVRGLVVGRPGLAGADNKKDLAVGLVVHARLDKSGVERNRLGLDCRRVRVDIQRRGGHFGRVCEVRGLKTARRG